MFQIRAIVIFLAVMSSTTFFAPSALATPESCAAPIPMGADDSERRPTARIGESHCFQVELSTHGMWHLKLEGTSQRSKPVLDVYAAGTALDASTHLRTVDERLVSAAPGTYWVHVRPEDPRLPLSGYRLDSRFAENHGRKSEEDGEPEIESEGFTTGTGCLPTKSEEDGEPEIESEGFTTGTGCLPTKSEEDGEPEIESEGFAAGTGCLPTKSEEDGEPEIESEGFTTGCERAKSLRRALCDRDDRDDHGDSLMCASVITGKLNGELSNGWGDDVDVFRFRLDSWQTVELSTAGSLGMRGELLDAQGRRLHTAQDHADDIHWIRSLGPGTYFLKLAASSEGPYTLNAAVLTP